jgi:hypothetical protein
VYHKPQPKAEPTPTFSLCSKHRTHSTSAFRSQPCEATENTKKKKEKQGTQKQDVACISSRHQ